QPGIGIIRHAGIRPFLECRQESFRERILRRCQITRAPAEISDQATIALARDLFRKGSRNGGLRTRHPAYSDRSLIRRTSTEPQVAAGQRAAHLLASSISATSMMK